MGRAAKDLHRRKFRNVHEKLVATLEACEITSFLQMVWSVDRLQSRFPADVRKYLTYPKEAAVTEIGEQMFVYKWELENLILLRFTVPDPDLRSATRLVNCRLFAALANLANLLRSAENHQGGALNDASNIMMEMHRLGHRQFGWQRGFGTSERLYRFMYIYGQGKCGDYFQAQCGMSVSDFVAVSFVLFVHLARTPWTSAPDLKAIGLDPQLLSKTLAIIAQPTSEMGSAVKGLIAKSYTERSSRIAYLPSALRAYPILTLDKGKTLIAPLADLVLFRATAGLYYDFCRGPQNLLADANERFEQYTRDLVEGFCPRFRAHGSIKYGSKKLPILSPDVLLQDGEKVAIVFECKATKLTFQAQFSENPIEEAANAYTQLAKGVAQLWRFFSHARRGVFDAIPLAENVRGVVLTMDPWLQNSPDLQDDTLKRAREMVSDDSDITEEDMKPVVFCAIQELSDILFISTEDEVLSVFEEAIKVKYRGWGLREVRRNLGFAEIKKKYPFDLAKLIPWWDALGKPQGAENIPLQ